MEFNLHESFLRQVLRVRILTTEGTERLCPFLRGWGFGEWLACGKQLSRSPLIFNHILWHQKSHQPKPPTFPWL